MNVRPLLKPQFLLRNQEVNASTGAAPGAGIEYMNKVHLRGVLKGAPRFRTAQSGRIFGAFTVKTVQNYQKDGQTFGKETWHRVVTGNDRIVEIAKGLNDGSGVYVEGALQTRKSVDAETNQEKRITEVYATRIEPV